MDFKRNSYEFFVRELFRWQYDSPNRFYSDLISLYRQADPANRWILENGYPQLGRAMEDWDNSADNGDALFVNVLGLEKGKDGFTKFNHP